jgi:hypothetical protein
LYATAIGQRAYTNPITKQGYFVSAIVNGLKGKAVDKQNRITLASLVDFLQRSVPIDVRKGLGQSKIQLPYAEIHGFLANDLVLSFSSSTVEPPPIGGEGIISVYSTRGGIIYIDDQNKGRLSGGDTKHFSKQSVGKHLVKIQGQTTEPQEGIEVIVERGKNTFVPFGVKSSINTSGNVQVGTLWMQSVSNVMGNVFVDNYRIGFMEVNSLLTITSLPTGTHRYLIEDDQESIEGSFVIKANEITRVAPSRDPSVPLLIIQ